MKNKNNSFNNNVSSVVIQMNNTMAYLDHLGYLHYRKTAKAMHKNTEIHPGEIKKYEEIVWDSHISGGVNCDASFTTLEQYEHIINSGAFHCILFDGSAIRSSFCFEGSNLISHSHLWWPAPYFDWTKLYGELTLQEMYLDFLSDPKWNLNLRMRSPIRIDFDSSHDEIDHPLVHMHTQYYETRINAIKPICFDRFIKYIFGNFYPNKDISTSKLNFLSFNYRKSKIDQYVFSSVIV